MKPWVFLDLDGTLIDSAVGITRSIAYALEKVGHAPLPEAQLLGWIGPALRTSFAPLLGDAARVEQAVAAYLERFEQLGWREHSIYPGIESALTALHDQGARLCLVTAKNEPHARRILAHAPFGDLFDEIVGATLDGSRSHKPQLVAEALHRTGAAPDDAVMVGDRHFDIEGAHHHGMDSAGVLWGFGSEAELRAAGAGRLLKSPRELAEWG